MDSETPPQDAAPRPMDRQQLAVVTGISLALATVVLVIAVLPAEHGIDPTGIGDALGIKAGPGGDAVPVHAGQDTAWTTHEFTFVLGPQADWVEEKVRMDAGQSFVYSWSADGPLVYDLHGAPASGDEISYDRGTASAANGTLSVTFDGQHGWAFRNPSDQTVTVTVQLAGFFRL